MKIYQKFEPFIKENQSNAVYKSEIADYRNSQIYCFWHNHYRRLMKILKEILQEGGIRRMCRLLLSDTIMKLRIGN